MFGKRTRPRAETCVRNEQPSAGESGESVASALDAALEQRRGSGAAAAKTRKGERERGVERDSVAPGAGDLIDIGGRQDAAVP